MTLSRLTALMPCRNLEDLSFQRTGEEAEELLSAWTALWHPALIAAARDMPHWASAENPPQDVEGRLILVPPCTEALLPGEWLPGTEAAGAVVLRRFHGRPEMTAAALEALARLQDTVPAVNAETVADFQALGFCHFTIEMLTQQMRYMSNLDESSFQRELLAAADAACTGDTDATQARLQAAFDLLHTARENYYQTEGHLLDLTLVASTTLGESLRAELTGGLPINLLISGNSLQQMAEREPDSLAALRQALESGSASILGGEFHELELPLLPLEAIRHQIVRGGEAYERHLGRRPTVFGRRRFGMTPVLPQILEKLGFTATLHATLDDGRFPTSNQSRIRWEGLDGSVLETVVRVPCDASRAEPFFRLSQSLNDSMHVDYLSTIVWAHWPGRGSAWYRDLERIRRYTTVLGSFRTATDYFEQTGMTGQQTAFKADEYRSPYLKQAVAAGQPDPISRWMRYYSQRAAAEAIHTMETLGTLVSRGSTMPEETLLDEIDDSPGATVPGATVPGATVPGATVPGATGVSPVLGLNTGKMPVAPAATVPAATVPAATVPGATVPGATGVSPVPGLNTGKMPVAPAATPDRKMPVAPAATPDRKMPVAPAATLDRRIHQRLQESAGALARSVTGGATAGSPGILVANPSSSGRRLCVDVSSLDALPEVSDPVHAAGQWEGRKTAVVDVPPMGFAWIGPTAEAAAKAPARKWGIFHRGPGDPPPLAELGTAENAASGRGGEAVGATLRNDLFELTIDKATGAIRAIFDYRHRGPRFAQQLGMRLAGASGDDDDAYSIMVADAIEIASPGPVVGEAVVRGRLLDRSARRLAGFKQTTRVCRGSRVIELDIELDVTEPPGPEPWGSYYAARFAWADETASLYRAVNQAVVETEAAMLESPHFVEVRREQQRTAVLAGGLPYHRRVGLRKLDTLLVVRGETARRFRLGMGIDLPQPLVAAMDFLVPAIVTDGRSRPAHPSAWLFHLDVRGVVATHWEPWMIDGRADGFRVRLLETEGRHVALGLRSFRPVRSAWRIDTIDHVPQDLATEGDRIAIDLRPYEWTEVEARFG